MCISITDSMQISEFLIKRAKMVLYRSPDYQTFQVIGLSVQEEKFNVDFQDRGHLGFPMRMILASSDLPRYRYTSNEVSSQLAFWFRIKKVHDRFSTWLLGRPSWISDQNDFSHF